MRVLVLNAGSSTLKASVLDVPGRDAHIATTVEWGDDATRSEGRLADVERLLEHLVVEGIPIGSIEAVGHRVVHGGARFIEPVVVDADVLAELDALGELAPLHNPVAVETVRAAIGALPDVAHVAVFDTAFHAPLDTAAVTYPLPRAWVETHRIRRYGFHGLSVAWSVRRAADLIEGDADELALVVAHLGSGCSVTAVLDGRSVATSMGMTPLEGLVMGTRAGSVDPGVLLRLLRAGVDVEDLAEGLDHRSGLLAISGTTADMRALLAAERDGDERAGLAVELFVRSAAAGIAAAATALPTIDGLVFTGGIGENAAAIRERIVGRLAVLGLRGPLSTPGDGDDQADLVLTPSGRSPAVLRIVAREDVVIAEGTVLAMEAG